MNYQLIILRYAEIGLKSEPIRKRFENVLIRNIKKQLKQKKIDFEFRKTRGRIYLLTDQINQSVTILRKIFGIQNISPAVMTNSTMESMTKKALEIAKEELSEDKTFALRVKREGTHSFTSQGTAIKIGDAIRKKTKAGVNLTNPDVTLFIEIRQKNAFFFLQKIPCAGGLPLGTQGNVLSIIEDDNSILASWDLMKRGCRSLFIVENKKLKEKLENFSEKWYIDLRIITSKENQDINQKIKETIYRYNIKAIVKGYSMIQNKKIELKEIKKLKEQTKIPILTPLIGLNEKEIKNKYKDIWLKSWI